MDDVQITTKFVVGSRLHFSMCLVLQCAVEGGHAQAVAVEIEKKGALGTLLENMRKANAVGNFMQITQHGTVEGTEVEVTYEKRELLDICELAATFAMERAKKNEEDELQGKEPEGKEELDRWLASLVCVTAELIEGRDPDEFAKEMVENLSRTMH